jgi:hypothetical protein
MLPYVPPEVAVRLMHRDSYPELGVRPHSKAHPLAASGRRLRPSALEAVVAEAPEARRDRRHRRSGRAPRTGARAMSHAPTACPAGSAASLLHLTRWYRLPLG